MSLLQPQIRLLASAAYCNGTATHLLNLKGTKSLELAYAIDNLAEVNISQPYNSDGYFKLHVGRWPETNESLELDPNFRCKVMYDLWLGGIVEIHRKDYNPLHPLSVEQCANLRFTLSQWTCQKLVSPQNSDLETALRSEVTKILEYEKKAIITHTSSQFWSHENVFCEKCGTKMYEHPHTPSNCGVLDTKAEVANAFISPCCVCRSQQQEQTKEKETSDKIDVASAVFLQRKAERIINNNSDGRYTRANYNEMLDVAIKSSHSINKVVQQFGEVLQEHLNFASKEKEIDTAVSRAESQSCDNVLHYMAVTCKKVIEMQSLLEELTKTVADLPTKSRPWDARNPVRPEEKATTCTTSEEEEESTTAAKKRKINESENKADSVNFVMGILRKNLGATPAIDEKEEMVEQQEEEEEEEEDDEDNYYVEMAPYPQGEENTESVD